MRFVDFLETVAGPVVVETTTVPWWFTIVTLGLFQKAVCRMGGPAYARQNVLSRQWRKKYGCIATENFKDEVRIFRTVWWRVYFWHEHVLEYARAMASVIDDHCTMMHLECMMADAAKAGDFNLVRRLRRRIMAEERQRAKKWHG